MPESTSLPAPIRVMNRAGGVVRRVRPGSARLDADDLLADAKRAAGLFDFGVGHFREGLDELVASLNAEARLSPFGVRIMRRMLTGLLAGRLRVRDFSKKSELVDYEVVRAPLVVVGIPRTGTTLLSHLLHHDPMNRSVLAWEAANVAPPPTLEGHASDPRLLAALRQRDGLAKLAPHLRAMHSMEPTEPTECVQLFGPAFRSLHFETLAHIPTYGRWWSECDMAPAYAQHSLQLRVLQSAIPTERWSLKSPAHLWHLDALRAAYPDARLIWAHRDPVRATASVSSLVTALRRLHSDHVDPRQVGAEWRDKLLHATAVGTAAIERWPDEQVFHLQYAEFVEDPVGTMERIYRTFGLTLSEMGRRRMEVWLGDHPKGRHGTHRYAAARFGLDEGALRRGFGDYIGEFRVPAE